MRLQTKKEEFLSNKMNKQSFIALLSHRLEEAGCDIHHAKGDADVLIVQTAIASAAQSETVLVGDDTDLLVLLIYHASNVRHNIFFRPEHRRGNEKGTKCWNISAMRAFLGNVVTKNILFLHAILGCDTTSGVHIRSRKETVGHQDKI